jgi:hypothetical protein
MRSRRCRSSAFFWFFPASPAFCRQAIVARVGAVRESEGPRITDVSFAFLAGLSGGN